jgi:hypothetical protein
MSYGPGFVAKSAVTRDCVPGHVGELPRCTPGRRREAPSTVPTRFHTATSPSTCPQLHFYQLSWKIYRPWRACFLAPKVTGLNASGFHRWEFIKDIAYVPIPLNYWGSRFHKPSCRSTSRWWTGHRQDEMSLGHVTFYETSAYWTFVNPRQTNRGCSALHFTSLTYVLKKWNLSCGFSKVYSSLYLPDSYRVPSQRQ